MENETLKFDWEYFIKEDLEQLNAEKSPDIYGSIIVTRGKKIFIVDVQWETVSSYGRRGISLNVYRSNEDHLHCDWIEDIKEIVTATNYKHFQHRAEKLITELIASVEKEPIVNAETYTTPAAGSIGTAKVICYDEYLHDYVEHTMLVRTIEKDPEMKTETNPEGVVLYGIDLSDDNDESMICTVSEGNYVCSAGVATVDELMKVERNEAYDRFAKEMKGLLPCFVSRDCSEIISLTMESLMELLVSISLSAQVSKLSSITAMILLLMKNWRYSSLVKIAILFCIFIRTKNMMHLKIRIPTILSVSVLPEMVNG